MFTVPEEYIEDKQLELMLKELSSLFFRLLKIYNLGNDNLTLKLKELYVTINKVTEKKYIKCLVTMEKEQFKLSFRATPDGFAFKDCSALWNNKDCNEKDILSFATQTNILNLLRDKLANAKESFILGN